MKNCLLLNKKPVRFSICASLVTAACVSMLNAADEVPDAWNAAPMTTGAYLEDFTSLPTWAGLSGDSVVTSTFPTMSGSSFPTRSNTWFSSTGNVLALDTAGTVITNQLEDSSSQPVSFAVNPVYVDMKVRFNPIEDDPDPAVLSNCKLAVFVNSEYKLVVASGTTSTTNSTVLDTNKWHQITVRMTNNICNVYRNDQLVFENVSLNNSSGTAKALDALSFKGAGYVDDLYVSRGDPTYAVEGPTTTIPTLPADGSNVPTDEQQTRINKYLSDQTNLNSLDMTQDELSAAYLADASLTGDNASATVAFGISKIEVVSATSVQITASLDVAGGAKAGAINGRIQLQGKVNKGDSWTTLSGAVSPGSVSFSGGEYTFTYTIPAGGYKFFKGQIIP